MFNPTKSLEVLAYLGINYQLTEIAIDGNPISSTTKFKNMLIASVPNLKVLDDEKVAELDREVAKQYFLMHNLTLPKFAGNSKVLKNEKEIDFNDFVSGKEPAPKKVKFADIDEDHEGDWQSNEILKLNNKIIELSLQNADLYSKLDAKNYTSTYRENTRLSLEVKNVYILAKENLDLKEDIERLESISHD